MSGALNGKVGAAFTSSATQHGGNETTLFSIIANLLHLGMIIVGLPYSFAGQMTLEEITGGAPYGDDNRWCRRFAAAQRDRARWRQTPRRNRRLHRQENFRLGAGFSRISLNAAKFQSQGRHGNRH